LGLITMKYRLGSGRRCHHPDQDEWKKKELHVCDLGEWFVVWAFFYEISYPSFVDPVGIATINIWRTMPNQSKSIEFTIPPSKATFALTNRSPHDWKQTLPATTWGWISR
jgi:hypothetical protein